MISFSLMKSSKRSSKISLEKLFTKRQRVKLLCQCHCVGRVCFKTTIPLQLIEQTFYAFICINTIRQSSYACTGLERLITLHYRYHNHIHYITKHNMYCNCTPLQLMVLYWYLLGSGTSSGGPWYW